eukprot:2503711-Pleurochrysis_carterae.AAC.2
MECMSSKSESEAEEERGEELSRGFGCELVLLHVCADVDEVRVDCTLACERHVRIGREPRTQDRWHAGGEEALEGLLARAQRLRLVRFEILDVVAQERLWLQNKLGGSVNADREAADEEEYRRHTVVHSIRIVEQYEVEQSHQRIDQPRAVPRELVEKQAVARGGARGSRGARQRALPGGGGGGGNGGSVLISIGVGTSSCHRCCFERHGHA